MLKIGKAAWEAQDPHKFEPHGDRLLVEEIEVEAVHYVGSTKIILAGTNEEIDRGWKLCRVIGKGNGHRMEVDVTVPMPFEIGDIVYVERFTGRCLRLQNKNFWIVNQVDVLGKAPDLPALMALPELERTA